MIMGIQGIGENLDSMGKIQGGEVGIGGDVYRDCAAVQFLVGQAGPFVAEDDRGPAPGIPVCQLRELTRSHPPALSFLPHSSRCTGYQCAVPGCVEQSFR